nr:PREDICTED: putative IQ motif and ankyrin repeat domain-containing protein LOC642574 homolog [Latimeria chalumnae]|eukprot:XP_014348759.1 PREDICTED: putative IQ motif and ankyrin repeat domain-containing protein LOC642574 homolog [Latimeria chalumnae]
MLLYPTVSQINVLQAPGQQTEKPDSKNPAKNQSKRPGSQPYDTPLPNTAGKKKELSREERSARTIQCAYRRHLARKERTKRQREKQEYEDLMDRLEKEAFVAMVRREQEEAERQRQKEEEERRKRREEQQRKKRILEAAFEGDMGEIQAIMKEVSELDSKDGVGWDERGKLIRFRHKMNMVECTDPNGNTPLSEAAGGGNVQTIKFLIQNGAELNSKGAYGRTPLYRAAFGGHLDAVQTLLQYGADPRIYADDGNKPEEVATLDSVASILHDWDVGVTESMLSKMEAEKARRVEEEKKQRAEEAGRLQEEVMKLTKEHDRCQKELQKAYCELNKRITEHDKCERKNMGKTDITLQAIHDAERTVDSLRVAALQAEEILSLAKLQLREQAQEGSTGEVKGLQCSVRELDDVLLKDVGNRIQQDGRWPLIIDPSGQAATFLCYRDTNYINTLNPQSMQPDVVRLSLLGAIRYGKPLVFDMMEVNMMESVRNQLNQIQNGLLEAILSKELLQNERYLSLTRPTDGPEYSRMQFTTSRTEKFKLFFVTKIRSPPEGMLSSFYPIQVVLPGPNP